MLDPILNQDCQDILKITSLKKFKKKKNFNFRWK